MFRDPDIRALTLVDLPLVRRLSERGVILDCELGLTRLHLSSLTSLLPQSGLYTLIARAAQQQVVGQFRYHTDDLYAQIVYIAPTLDPTEDNTAWLQVLDGMAREAGKHGIHALLAEICEDDPLFETLRAAGYAVYARQAILRRDPTYALPDTPPLPLREATDADLFGIHTLFTATVPRLVQPFSTPPAEMSGLIYERDGQIVALIAYAEGKHGIYLVPYLHPNVEDQASALFNAALQQLPRAAKLPVYVCIRRYQDWLGDRLDGLGFAPLLQQAVMVKHLAAGVRQTHFASLTYQSERGIAQPSHQVTRQSDHLGLA
ncbi:MAG: hypothetical protein MUF87_10325 [Anaerolineae bacterium]|jgi:hypothetical protein|nr:hypothetical protein [Anaerolineae bacterium]